MAALRQASLTVIDIAKEWLHVSQAAEAQHLALEMACIGLCMVLRLVGGPPKPGKDLRQPRCS